MSSYAVNPRNRIHGKVEFHEIDPTAAGDSVLTPSAQDSRSDQNIYSPVAAKKVASFEADRWILDGSWPFYDPDDATAKYGWWSPTLSRIDGQVSPAVTLTFTFSSLHTCRMLTFYWDVACGTYPTDYSVALYASTNLLQSFTLVASSSISFVEVDQFNFDKIVVTIRKWSKQYTKPRMECILFGIVNTFDESKLISFTVNSKIDETNSLLDPSTLTVNVINLDKTYNPISGTSADKFYQKNQYMIPFIAVENYDGSYGFQSMGVYYLDSWDTSTSTASFKAMNRLYQLEKAFPDTVYTAQSLGYILDAVFSLCGIDEYAYPESFNTKIVTVKLSGLTCRQIIQYAASAMSCSVYVDQNNNICIGSPRRVISQAITASIGQEPQAKVLPPYSVLNISRYVYNATDDKMDETSDPVTIGASGSTVQYSGNVFLQSHEDVVAAADYLNNLRTQQRVEFTVPWIQDPNIRPGDQMHFYTRYAETPVQGVVGEQELVFDGGLRGATIIRAPMQG